MEAMIADDDVKDHHSVVRVELTRSSNGDEELTWQLYAYGVQSDSAWSTTFATFAEALENLKGAFKKQEKKRSFVEE